MNQIRTTYYTPSRTERALDRIAGWFACDRFIHSSWLEGRIDNTQFSIRSRRISSGKGLVR